jgi:hypothetical protein
MSGKCECTACGQIFKSSRGFDMHRIGGYGEPIYKITSKGKRGEVTSYTKPNRRCMTEGEMLARGMVKNDKGQWITEAYDKSIVHKEDEDEIEEVAD